MKRLIKTFEEETRLNNVLVPLTLDVDEVIFVFHHEVSQRRINNCSKVISRHKNIKLLFKRVGIDDIDELITDDCLIDISAARYLSIALYGAAMRHDLPIIYYDEEERVIKEFNKHEVIAEKVFSLDIEDIVTLGGGKILSTQHRPVERRESIELIYNAVEKAGGQYNLFTAYVSRINSYLSDLTPSHNVYHLDEDTVRKIVTDEQYRRYKDLDLFRIEGTDLRFKNSDIRKIFMVTGEFLENYIYHKLIDDGFFDDVLMSSTIEFSDEKWKYPVTCEIDCLVLKDNDLQMVSIKSNKVEKDDLNEIKVHNVVFGNEQSHPVICINSDLSDKRPSIYAKAEELGVYVIDGTSFLNGTVVEQFIDIARGTYEYEKI